MKWVKCEVEAVVRFHHTITVQVSDPTDDEAIDNVLYPEWENRMDEMVLAHPYDDWDMEEWRLTDKEVVNDE